MGMAVALTMSTPASAVIVSLNENIVTHLSTNGGVNQYTFTDASGSVTLQIDSSSPGSYVDGDAGTRVWSTASGGGGDDPFAFGQAEPLSFIVTFVSATGNVDPNSVAFRLDSVGIRPFAADTFHRYVSDVTDTGVVNTPGDNGAGTETDVTMDTSFFTIGDSGTYTGTLSWPDNNSSRPFRQLSTVTATDGFNISVSFIPEPASLSLIGLGGLMTLRRRRR